MKLIIKKLKDAGFPLVPAPNQYKLNGYGKESPKRSAYREIIALDGYETGSYFTPTLSELIDACGGTYGGYMLGKIHGFLGLRIIGKEPGLFTPLWEASGTDIIATGLSPEEAMAHLFLKLKETYKEKFDALVDGRLLKDGRILDK